jgi:DNA-binding MarR family transcriptional regulator
MTIPILEESLAYRIHRAARLLRQDFLRCATSAGVELTPEQWFLVNKLRHTDGASQSELSDALLDDRPNISRILAGLEERGLVARRDDPEDSRRKRVSLTEAGTALHDRFAVEVFERRRSLLGALDPEDLATVTRVLDALESELRA